MNGFIKTMSVFFLILALGTTVILGLRNLSDGSQFEKMETLQTALKSGDAQDNALLKSIGESFGSLTAGQFNRGGLASLLLAIMILVFIFLTLASRRALITKAALLMLGIALVAIVLNPHFSSALGPASSRILASVAAGLTLAGAGLALLWLKRTQAA